MEICSKITWFILLFGESNILETIPTHLAISIISENNLKRWNPRKLPPLWQTEIKRDCAMLDIQVTLELRQMRELTQQLGQLWISSQPRNQNWQALPKKNSNCFGVKKQNGLFQLRPNLRKDSKTRKSHLVLTMHWAYTNCTYFLYSRSGQNVH